MRTSTLIVGPDGAAPFLSRVRDALAPAVANVQLRTGGEAVFDTDTWPEVEVLVAFGIKVDAETMRRGRALRAIVVPSLGYEFVDVDAASAQGIIVANGQVRENYESVAEAAILFLLMAFYDIQAAERRLRDGVQRQGAPSARMLKGKTVGIIGYGNIAREVVARLAGWDVSTLIHTHRPIAPADDRVSQVGLDELLAQSDAILPLVPLTPTTHHLLDRQRLLRAKEGSILVNLSRGAVINEEALCDPSVAARFKKVALDVFETEPLPANSELRNLPNGILTGHEAAHTSENLTALFDLTIENVRSAAAGVVPKTALNPGAWLLSMRRR